MTQAHIEAALIEGDEIASRRAKELVANTLEVGVDEIPQKMASAIQGTKSAERGKPNCAQPPNFVSIGDSYITQAKDIRAVLVRDISDSDIDFEVEILYRDGQSTLVKMSINRDAPLDKMNWLAGLKSVLNGSVD